MKGNDMLTRWLNSLWARVLEANTEIGARKFVSWYLAPQRDERSTKYLAKGYKGGWIYVADLANAHRFDTQAEAEQVTPIYDGSAGIEQRAGVLPVAA
jgi:hypothetical protein